MLSPKRTKFRKQHKGRIKGEAKGGSDLNFGSYGLKAIEPDRINARQIEAARRAMTRHMKRQGRVWIRIFPDVPVSQKPIEVRMGKGKGSPEYWAAKVKPGRIMFEIDGVSDSVAREALRLAAMKIKLQAARVFLRQAAWKLDTKAYDATKYCAMAKTFVTDAAFEVANDALQLHGGYGYLADYGIEKIVRDLRVHQILEGTNEIMHLIVSRQLIADRG